MSQNYPKWCKQFFQSGQKLSDAVYRPILVNRLLNRYSETQYSNGLASGALGEAIVRYNWTEELLFSDNSIGWNVCISTASVILPKYFPYNIRHWFWYYNRRLWAESDDMPLWLPTPITMTDYWVVVSNYRQ